MSGFSVSLVEGFQLVAKALSYFCALAAVGTLTFVQTFQASLRGREATVFTRQAAGLVVCATVASLAGLFATVALLNGRGLAGGFDGELWLLVAGTANGDAVWVRLLGLAALLPGLFFARLRLPAVVLGGLAVAASFGFVGHVQDDRHSLLLHALLMLHLLAVAIWIGSLWPLWRLARTPEPERVAAVMERFGRLGVYFVICLLAAGIGLTWLLLDGLVALFTTSYGLMLSGKMALAGLLLLVAALNKWRLVPALVSGSPDAGPRLRRSIAAEICLVVAILSVTALLTSAFSPA